MNDHNICLKRIPQNVMSCLLALCCKTELSQKTRHKFNADHAVRLVIPRLAPASCNGEVLYLFSYKTGVCSSKSVVNIQISLV